MNRAKDFVINGSQNALVFGHNETTRSDLRIFNADGGGLMHQFAASQDLFFSTCTRLFERMINTVPRGIQLTDVIAPIPVKPVKLELSLSPNNTILLTGNIRVSLG